MKILVADDDPSDRLIMERILVSQGHEVVKAKDGLEAVTELTRSYYPIVLMDWMMPGLEGPDICRRIREAEKGGDRFTYIIIVTAKDRKENIIEALASGADDYITKPVDSDVLGSRVRVAQRIVTTHEALADRNDRLGQLQSKLVMHNINLSDQVEALKKHLSDSPQPRPSASGKGSNLTAGEAYLVECRDSRGTKAYGLFAEELASGTPGFIMSRWSAEKIEKSHGVKEATIITLSKGLIEGDRSLPLNFLALDTEHGSHSALRNLQPIVELVREYMEKNSGGAVLLDGVEYLFTRFGTLPVMEMLYELGEVARRFGGKLIVAYYPETLDQKIPPLLKREMNWIPDE